MGRTTQTRREADQFTFAQPVGLAPLDPPYKTSTSIAAALLRTLPPPESDEWDDDPLAANLDQRLEDALTDPSSTVSWSDLKARA